MVAHQIGKKIAVLIGSLLVSLLLAEFGASLAYQIRHRENFSKSKILARLSSSLSFEVNPQAEGSDSATPYISNKILHPYLGFVYSPDRPNANSFGFFGSEPLMLRSAETLNIAIFGGSVALTFAGEGVPTLVEELKTVATNRHIHMACFAIDGYKQPQHLIALAFLLSLGAEFDIAINLDGFNEIVLPVSENFPAEVFPYYPRSWNLYAAGGFQPEVALAIAEIADNRASRSLWRRLFSRWPLRHSAFALVAWDALDRRLESRELLLDARIRGLLPAGPGATSTRGPFRPEMTEEDVLQESVQVWRESSLQMAALCRANGIRYFHFLQPNQYVPGSKTFTEEELRLAFGQGDYQSAARAYPLLMEEGRSLRDGGVLFYDLTDVFKDERETVYIDNCCHFNLRGNQILARAIGSQIRRELERSQRAPSSQ